MEHKNSHQAYLEAQKLIPGGVNSPVRAFKGVGGEPPFMEKGKGGFIYDIDGNRYIDYVQSWGPLILGHADPDIVETLTKAASKGLSFGAPTEMETELAKLLCESYQGLDKVRFVSSGTEATMSAIRLARGFTGKEDVIKFEGCYHGHADSLLVKAGSGAATFGTPSSPGVPHDFGKHTLVATYNDIDSVEAFIQHNHNIACIIIEPIAGNMGMVPSQPEFLKQLRELCTKHGIVLIFDEVMSGFRTSYGGSQGVYGIVPDMACFGKVIGGGMPVGAFGGQSDIMRELSPEGPVYQAGTLSGNPLAMAVGVATLEKIKNEPRLYEKLENRGKKLAEGLKREAKRNGIALQSQAIGSMFGFFFNASPVHNFQEAAQSDLEMFAKFHQKMLHMGTYFACSQFEAGFISMQTNDSMIDQTIAYAALAFEELAQTS